MNNFKNDIKELVEKQKHYRNQSRTVRLVGPRTMDPRAAAIAHRDNGLVLFIMYVAYGELRGKPIEVTCKGMKGTVSDHVRKRIDDIKEKYAIPVLDVMPVFELPNPVPNIYREMGFGAEKLGETSRPDFTSR